RRDRVAGLSEHAFDPAPYLRFRIGGRADPRVQVVDKLTLSVGEHREQQSVLRGEVAVEGLVREPRGLDDVAHLRIDVAGGAHHGERGVDEAPDLGRVLPAALRQSRIRQAFLDRNNVLHYENTIPSAARQQSAVSFPPNSWENFWPPGVGFAPNSWENFSPSGVGFAPNSWEDLGGLGSGGGLEAL